MPDVARFKIQASLVSLLMDRHLWLHQRPRLTRNVDVKRKVSLSGYRNLLSGSLNREPVSNILVGYAYSVSYPRNPQVLKAHRPFSTTSNDVIEGSLTERSIPALWSSDKIIACPSGGSRRVGDYLKYPKTRMSIEDAVIHYAGKFERAASVKILGPMHRGKDPEIHVTFKIWNREGKLIPCVYKDLNGKTKTGDKHHVHLHQVRNLPPEEKGAIPQKGAEKVAQKRSKGGSK